MSCTKQRNVAENKVWVWVLLVCMGYRLRIMLCMAGVYCFVVLFNRSSGTWADVQDTMDALSNDGHRVQSEVGSEVGSEVD